MPRIHFETDPAVNCGPGFTGPTDVLVYFLSLAFSTRYGAQHDLSKLALALRGEHKIDLRPLLTFADRDVEEEADAVELKRVWQDAAPLAGTLERVTAVLEAADGEIAELIAPTPDLLPRLRELQALAACAARHGTRVRISYDL